MKSKEEIWFSRYSCLCSEEHGSERGRPGSSINISFTQPDDNFFLYHGFFFITTVGLDQWDQAKNEHQRLGACESPVMELAFPAVCCQAQI